MKTEHLSALEIPELVPSAHQPPSAAPSLSVPWGPRDVWFGLALLALWMVLALAGALVVGLLQLDWDVGLLITLFQAVLLLPAWWLTIRKYRVGLDALGLRRFSPVMLVLVLGLMLVGYTVNMVNALVLFLLDLSPDVNLADLFARLEHPWFLFLGGVVVAPIAEEIFFRGFVFAGLRGRYGWVRAALVSAAVFALIHAQPKIVVPHFVLGFLLALLYEKSRSLWPAIAMHAAINAIGLTAAYFAFRMGLLPGS